MIRYFVLALTFGIMVLPTTMAHAASLPNGAECATLPSTTTGAEVDKVRGQCESSYCLPGPSEKRSLTTTWYCAAAGENCAWPGENGHHFGTPKWRFGYVYHCKDPGDGGSAQFLPMQ